MFKAVSNCILPDNYVSILQKLKPQNETQHSKYLLLVVVSEYKLYLMIAVTSNSGKVLATQI
jgi:hypothetical protein